MLINTVPVKRASSQQTVAILLFIQHVFINQASLEKLTQLNTDFYHTFRGLLLSLHKYPNFQIQQMQLFCIHGFILE